MEWHELRRLYRKYGLTRQEQHSVQSGNPSSTDEIPPSSIDDGPVQDTTHQVPANASSSAVTPVLSTLNSFRNSLYEPPIAAFEGERRRYVVADGGDDIIEASKFSGASSSNKGLCHLSTTNCARSPTEIDEIIDDPMPKNSRKKKSPAKKIRYKGSPPPPKILIDLTQPVIDLTGPIVVDLTLDDDDDLPSTRPTLPLPVRHSPSAPNDPKNHPVSASQSSTIDLTPSIPRISAPPVTKLIPFDNSQPLPNLRNLSPPQPKAMQPVASTSLSTSQSPCKDWKLSVGAIERHWNDVAREVGAASISFVNDVDDERVPPGLDRFVYMESWFS